ncbi:hypothetical protein GCM10022384_66740 [Streptomyces marokkonensis]|uniref:MFS transporter n=1 Tax=Streptomyces marokkonensis TaxID=324855 RepID=A0ABP7SJW3_9ACTN
MVPTGSIVVLGSDGTGRFDPGSGYGHRRAAGAGDRVSAALPLLSSSAIAVFASAAAYGVTFTAVPAAVTACIRTVLQPVDRTATLAAFTTLFAAGQTVGPWLAGVLAEHTTTAAPLAWTALLSAGAAVLSAIPSRPEPHTEAPFETNAQNMGSRR